jgi:CRISPR-associated endonuclease/helicase Cas3
MNGAPFGFNETFAALFEGRTPFHWQRRLFEQFVQGRVPPICTLPTGLGKTSVIPIWLIALAHSALTNNGEPRLPRRLVYIVNRRTVVDQATDDAMRLLGCMYRSGQLDRLAWAMDEAIGSLGLKDEPPLASTHAPGVAALRNALAALSGDDVAAPLAVSTLRGELADNGEWKRNPARPAIIVGTIDMIGSKLLFSGYGDGRYGRAHHAGLIGQDALIVHDEAHLSPAFSRLLWKIEREQREANEPRPLRVLELSATSRDDAQEDREAVRRLCDKEAGAGFTLIEEDGNDTIVARRRTASKTLTFQPCEAGNGKLAKAIAAKALTYRDSKARVLIYVRLPDDAKRIRNTIADSRTGLGKGADGRVRLLTGTIRGFERDQLAKSDLFKAFRSDAARPLQLERTLYLVSTSAGEVGADLDADHLVCDLTTLESMAQRFGRVNRLGGADRSAEVTVVCEEARTNGDGKKQKGPSPLDTAIAKTREILREVEKDGGDVSPGALSQVLAGTDAEAAFSPAPGILPATDILFDAWALTSITGDLPGRPDAGPYLHGVADWEPPETYVAWRAELAELARGGVSDDDLEDVFDAFPIWAVERLRDRTDRILEELQKVADRLNQESPRADAADEAPRPRLERDPRVVLIKQNRVQWARLSQLAPADRRQKDAAISRLAHAIVVLPVEAGGLRADGTLAGGAPPPADPITLDVAETLAAGQRARRRVWINEDNAEMSLIPAGSNGALPCRLRVKLADDEESEDEVGGGSRKIAIEYRVAPREAAEPGTEVALRDHTSAVEAAANRIGRAMGLNEPLCEALTLAARWHDNGKDLAVWQRYARNDDPAGHPLAKARRYLHPRVLGGYRHEFGSLLEALADGAVHAHPERDLVLHLIAAHHGWARPHFERAHFDRGDAGKPRPTAENEAAAVEVMQRFGRLEQRFGRWGLAWLESLVRCADALASTGVARDDRGTPSVEGGMR